MREKRGTVPIISERMYPHFVKNKLAQNEYFRHEIGVNFSHL
jgi:hypothetical protein